MAEKNETDPAEVTIRQIVDGCEPMGNLENLVIDDLTEDEEDQFFGILEDQ